MRTPASVDVTSCARCGGDHIEVRLLPLTREMECTPGCGQTWTHWGTCPETGEPLMMRFTKAG